MASPSGMTVLLIAFAVAQLAFVAQATRPGPMLIVLQGPLNAFGAERTGPFQMVREMPQQPSEDPFALLDSVFGDRHSLFGPAFGPQMGAGPESPFGELFGPRHMPRRRRCGSGQPMAHPDMLQHLAHARFGPGLLSALLEDARRGEIPGTVAREAFADAEEGDALQGIAAYAAEADVGAAERRGYAAVAEGRPLRETYYTTEGPLEDAAFAVEGGDLWSDAAGAVNEEPVYRIKPVRKERAVPFRDWASMEGDSADWEMPGRRFSHEEVDRLLAEAHAGTANWKQEAASAQQAEHGSWDTQEERQDPARQESHGSWGFTKRLGQAHFPSSFFPGLGDHPRHARPMTVTHRTFTAAGLPSDARQPRRQDAEVEWTLFDSDDQVNAGALIFLVLCLACVFVWARLIVLACTFARGCGGGRRHGRGCSRHCSSKGDRAACKASKAARRAEIAAEKLSKGELEEPLLNPLDHEALTAAEPYRVEVAAKHAPSAPAGYVTLQYVPLRSEEH